MTEPVPLLRRSWRRLRPRNQTRIAELVAQVAGEVGVSVRLLEQLSRGERLQKLEVARGRIVQTREEGVRDPKAVRGTNEQVGRPLAGDENALVLGGAPL